MKQETPLQKLIAEYEEYIKIAELDIEEAKKVNSSLMLARAESQITAYRVAIAIAQSKLPYERDVIENSYDQHRCVGNFENGKQYFELTFKTE